MADTTLGKVAHWSQILNLPIAILAAVLAAWPLVRPERQQVGAPVQEASMTSYWPLALLAVCILGSAVLHMIAVTRRQGVSTKSRVSARGQKLPTARIVILCGVGVFAIILTLVLVRTFRYVPEPVQQPSIVSIPPRFQGAKDGNELVEVRNKTFVNERVILDGHRYTGCRFLNATLVYNGTAAYSFDNNIVSGMVKFSTDSEVVTMAWIMAKAFSPLGMEMVDKDFQPMKDVEPVQVQTPPPSATPTPTPQTRRSTRGQRI